MRLFRGEIILSHSQSYYVNSPQTWNLNPFFTEEKFKTLLTAFVSLQGDSLPCGIFTERVFYNNKRVSFYCHGNEKAIRIVAVVRLGNSCN